MQKFQTREDGTYPDFATARAYDCRAYDCRAYDCRAYDCRAYHAGTDCRAYRAAIAGIDSRAYEDRSCCGHL